MRILRIYIPHYRAKREIRFFECLRHMDKHKELIRFMSVTLDES